MAALRSQRLERFFARENRRRLTGASKAQALIRIRVPTKGPISPLLAAKLGLVRTEAPLEDPTSCHWRPLLASDAGQGAVVSPFLPIKKITGRGWMGPLLGSMDWKRIWSAAHRQGLESYLPQAPGKKDETLLKRGRAREQSVVDEASLVDLAAQFWSTARPKPISTEQMASEVQMYTRQRGPYTGRRGPAFKGKKWERRKPERQAAIAQKVLEMPKRIETYRTVGLMPGLPFVTYLACSLQALQKTRNTARRKHAY